MTRSFIVGTAGHVDHGKSALVHALTGTDPDRLKEEKERGITIDLGFAHASLGPGLEASFVDVPGHERFVRNMLAGAHGIDAVLLVVAADESVMPQTREHFHICRLLGIRRGLVALTKCDVADAESQALAEMEVRELVAGSFLEGAPIVRTSARTREGLEELVARLAALAEAAGPRATDGVLRLPVDRVFTLRGFGTVVTGTLVSGALAEGDEVEALPSGRRGRVRGLQVHGQPVSRADAGHRTAANLSGLEVQDLARGHVVARPGELRATSLLDVSLSALPGGRGLREQQRVRVHVASAETLARVRLLGPRELASGAAEVAQLRLETPVVAVRGDRLIVRSYSPATTIAGAVVLDSLPPKRRAADRPVLERLAAARDDTAAAALFLAEAGARAGDASALGARLGLPSRAVRERLSSTPGVVALGGEPEIWIDGAALRGLAERALEAVRGYHAANPLREAMPREELRRRVFAKAAAAALDRALADLAARGELRPSGDGVALARHAVRLDPAEQSARDALLAAASRAGLEGVRVTEAARADGRDAGLYERVARVLQASHELRRVGDDRLVDAARLAELTRAVRARWPPGSRLDVGGFKELTGLTRKFVIPLLEYLDRERVTRRAGAERYVLP
ncbi:MAG TPA: selenocysteine-specific translation elongation factor [Vicinamibacteria bacterium]|nr:selenocysteine-specific translation elongation factor [Vicinamibacteria bacterium]